MAYLLVNARSEFVTSTKFGDGGVLETTFKFQIASAASIFPAFSPIRGSGLGGFADMSRLGEGPPDSLELDPAHAAVANRAAARDSDRSGVATMRGSLRGRASFPSERSRWIDRR